LNASDATFLKEISDYDKEREGCAEDLAPVDFTVATVEDEQ